MKRFFLLFLLALACTSMQAQFSLTGSDPSWVRWKQIKTLEFKIIFPEGEDSLATVYAGWLEKSRTAVGLSSGLTIGKNYKGRIPVVLHSFHTLSNASVAWAPKRIDVFTSPDPYNPTPIPWEKLLSIHEGRHLSQMHAGISGPHKVMHYILGEMYAGALAGIYPGPTFLEGDAVVTETALTGSGRGRQASFISYLMPAFDSGDWRDYWRWSLGSMKYYTPDYYKAGYMMISGMRVFYDDPLFTKEYFDRVAGKSLFFNLGKTIKDAGGTSIVGAFRTIEQSYQCLWAEEALARGPFIPSVQVSKPSWRHSSYGGSVFDGKTGIWSVRDGLTIPTALVNLDAEGNIVKSIPFSPSTGALYYDGANNRLWWSEAVPHWRWTLAGSSRIRYINLSEPSKTRNLTKVGKYFNPSPSPDGKYVCVTEYPSKGGSRLVILNASNGSEERFVQAPDSLQFTESAWAGDRLFVAGLSEKGMGIYEIANYSIIRIIGPQPVELSDLRPQLPSVLSFVCDRTGVSEMYLLDVDTRSLKQATSTRYGIRSPFFGPGADTLYYSALAPSDDPAAYKQGFMIYSTAVSDLPMEDVSFDDIHSWRVADVLSAQEKALAEQEKASPFPELVEESVVRQAHQPERYHKLLPTIHSWAPLYFNYDNVESISGDSYYKTASLGATFLFQNLVGDGYGFIGYSAHEDPDLRGAWRHSGHFKYLYTGFLPVVELSADLGDRAATRLMRVQQTDVETKKESVFTARERAETPYLDSYLRIYLPVNLNSGGFSRGFVPQAKFRFTNDIYNDRISVRELITEDDHPVSKEISSLGTDHSSMMATVDLSLRGYVMRNRAPSQVYPKIGIGAEAGFRTRPGHSQAYSNTAYLYLYGYLPGILQDQGLKLSAVIGQNLGKGKYSAPDMPVSFIPRGFVNTNVKSLTNPCSPSRMKLSADYAIPFLNLDWSGLCPAAYVKNLEITPFLDWSVQKFKDFNDYHINGTGLEKESLASIGADLTVCLGNLLWIPYDSRIGIRYAYNSWNDIDRFPVKGLSHHYFGGIFSVSL